MATTQLVAVVCFLAISLAAGTPAIEATFIGNLSMPVFLPVGAASCHYEDPFQPAGCQSGEVNITVQNVPGSFCSPKCDSSGACPTDTCSGTVAAPQCVLQDGTPLVAFAYRGVITSVPGSGNHYCALVCDPSSKTEACSSGEHLDCKAIQGTGLCTYYS